jgi:catechol 2,3-dioxygenase-like lactoylglutathione lyase family enzyme
MLHHVELYVSDLQRSLAFWTPFLGRLGYHESQRWSEGVSYAHERTYLCFVQAPAEHLASGYHRRRIGLNHLAFHARSRPHVDEMAAWVKAAGYTVLYEEQYPYAGGPGYYALYCEDPDRMKVELVAPPEPTQAHDAAP